MNADYPQDADAAAAERRDYERSRIILNVHFDGAELTGVANTRDMSLGGLYMNTRAQLPEGATLTLRIPFGAESEAIVTAQVMYVNPGIGVGLRFVALSERDRLVLERELTPS